MNRCCGRLDEPHIGTGHELLYIHQNPHALVNGA
jgi:hypothetical protein